MPVYGLPGVLYFLEIEIDGYALACAATIYLREHRPGDMAHGDTLAAAGVALDQGDFFPPASQGARERRLAAQLHPPPAEPAAAARRLNFSLKFSEIAIAPIFGDIARI